MDYKPVPLYKLLSYPIIMGNCVGKKKVTKINIYTTTLSSPSSFPIIPAPLSAPLPAPLSTPLPTPSLAPSPPPDISVSNSTKLLYIITQATELNWKLENYNLSENERKEIETKLQKIYETL